jgi:hypothetical protein
MKNRKLLFVMAAALILATSPASAHAFNYLCKIDGKTYPLRMDESKNVLEWTGKKYQIVVQPDCGRYGWHAEGNGAAFNFCTATQGVGGCA